MLVFGGPSKVGRTPMLVTPGLTIAVERAEGGVDAVGRQQLVLGGEVRRREPQLPPAARALHDHAVDGEVPAEQRPGFLDAALRTPGAGSACSTRRSPCSGSGSIFSARKPSCWPSVRSSVKLPDRLRPNRKSAPTQTSATRSQSTSTRRTKVSGSHCDSSSVKRTTATPCTPARSSASRFCCGVISSGGALSGRSTRGGWGSKVRTSDGAAALGGAPADALDDLHVPAVQAVEVADAPAPDTATRRPRHRRETG